MRDLVTVFGATGFVGRYVVRALAKDGWRIRVAARRPAAAPELMVMGGVGQIELAVCDVRDAAQAKAALDGSDAAVNLVGVLFERGAQGFQALHAQAAAQLARLSAEAGVRRFVQMSALGADAGSASLYARTKAAGEAAVRTAMPQTVVLRPSVVFGPEDAFFNRFAAMAGYSPVLPLIGGGSTRFQPVYAGDVGAAVAAALRQDTAGTFELGGPAVYSFRTLMEILLREIGRHRALVPVPFPLASLLGEVGDLVGLTGLAPPVTKDQVELLKTDNVVTPGALDLVSLGVEPTALEGVIPSYLWRYRRGGQFAQPESHNA